MLRNWPRFSANELVCACCGVHRMHDGFMARLEKLRDAMDMPLRLSSAYRCPRHNVFVSNTGPRGPHTTGHAVDILIAGADALRLVQHAIACGMTGIGISQKGAHASRFVHVDDLPDGAGHPRPWLWTY
jgi:uncharacterized protein YcbK (DUF882 family)